MAIQADQLPSDLVVALEGPDHLHLLPQESLADHFQNGNSGRSASVGSGGGAGRS